MGRAQKALSALTVVGTKSYGDVEHEITLGEFADLIEFCSNGHLVVEVRNLADDDRSLSKLHGSGVETYPNRGQIHCAELTDTEVAPV